MSKDTTATKQTGKNTLIKLGVIVTLIFALFTSVMQVATYPTAEHRHIANEIEKINHKLFSEQNSASDQERASSLAATPENQYSTKLMFVEMVTFFALSIVATGYLYRHIRSRRLARNPLYATVNIMVISSIITSMYALIFSVVFVGYQMPGILELGAVITGSTLLTLLFTLLIASIFKNIYDRKHSFEID